MRVLIGPATERLLRVLPGETVLDVACGNGVFSRRLAELGARVVAIYFSEKFVELARARTEQAGYGDAVEYLVADATDLTQAQACLQKLRQARNKIWRLLSAWSFSASG
jgi:2-polyprenyl-3-methyl-5-hydroxy-6-metoxy-1,4-benzoquinol methylase